MRTVMNYRPSFLVICGMLLLTPRAGMAETQEYCVICSGPDQTYRCQVNTHRNNSGDKGLQLYCIIRVSKDGGHKSCAVKDEISAVCAGPIRAYTFAAPALSPKLKSAVDKLSKPRNRAMDNQDTLTEQKSGEPKTLLDVTGRAVKASRKGLKKTGQAVTGAAGSTTRKVGTAARGAGKGVTKTAKKVGAATKKTGSAVGSAAKTAFDCLKSWFKKCGSEPDTGVPASQ